MPPIMSAMKHSATFSLQACREGLSFKPPMDDKRNGGAHQVTKWANMDHGSQKEGPAATTGSNAAWGPLAVPGAAEGGMMAGGLISGAGLTLLSGLVSVLPRLREVARWWPLERVGCLVGGGLVVGKGTFES